MWILVAILIAIVLYLIVLASGKADELQSEIDEADDEIEKLSKNYQEQIQTAVNNNTILINKNRNLQGIIYQIEDLVTGQRTDREVRAKIKELLLSGKNSNQN